MKNNEFIKVSLHPLGLIFEFIIVQEIEIIKKSQLVTFEKLKTSKNMTVQLQVLIDFLLLE